MRSLTISTLQQILFGRSNQEEWDGRGTGTCWGEERSKQGFSEPEGEKSLGRPRRRWIFRKWDGGGMDGIYLAHSRDRWRALVDAVMNLRVP